MSNELRDADKALLEELFSKTKRAAPKAPAPPKNPQDKLKISLDPTREQNVGIVLSYLKLPVSEIKEALLTLDDGKLSYDILGGLQSILPNAEEVRIVEPYLTEPPEVQARLSMAAQFFLMTATIPRIGNRIECWLVRNSFDLTQDQVLGELGPLNKAANALKNSDKWEKMLKLILRTGNFMNQGTRVGDCQGFRISDLEKLGNCRTTDNKSNLLQTLVGICLKTDRDLLDFTSEMAPVRQACVIDINETRQAITELNKSMTTLVRELNLREMEKKEAVKQGTQVMADAFSSKMGDFYNSKKDELQEMWDQLSNTEQTLKLLGEYYGENPADFQAADFFQNITSFCKQVETNKKQLAHEVYEGKDIP
uniref:FH2 domain-containing protein n=1 Tax=Eutreptiella gymnastica TaxID=73025 RepID=A0A7S1NMM9_9EUGL